jgi:hypothetical protein
LAGTDLRLDGAQRGQRAGLLPHRTAAGCRTRDQGRDLNVLERSAATYSLQFASKPTVSLASSDAAEAAGKRTSACRVANLVMLISKGGFGADMSWNVKGLAHTLVALHVPSRRMVVGRSENVD